MHLSCRNGSGLAQQVGEPGIDLTVDLRVCDRAVHQDAILPSQQELKCFCVVPSKIPPVPLPDMVSVPIVRVSSSGCQPFFRRFSHTEMQEFPAERAAHPGFLSLRPNML